jgi:glycosyltransferase involved in cell wall biosynthesis
VPGAWWALRRGRYDVVQGWTAPAALAAAGSGKPSVYVFQGVLHDDDLRDRPRVRALLMRAARGCDAIVAYSDVAAEAFTALTGIGAQAIEPGIRLDAFTPGAERNATPAIFCAADPDEPRKRVRLLVDAFAQVREQQPEAELWLMSTRDRAIANAPGVRIVDPGADRDELVRLYRAAWITVLPAFREAFGLVVVESLACGTPAIVMSDGGGAPGIVADAGSVAAPDASSLARSLADAIALPPDAPTAVSCRARAEEFSIERCAERYEALYTGIASTAA